MSRFKKGDVVERIEESSHFKMKIGSRHTVAQVDGREIYIGGGVGWWSACNFRLVETDDETWERRAVPFTLGG